MSVDHDCSELPPELLFTIINKLINLREHLHFRAVCSTWRSSTPATPKDLPCQLPWLMHDRCGFFNFIDNMLHFLNLPEALNRLTINLPPVNQFTNVMNFDFYNVGREYTLRSRDSFIRKVLAYCKNGEKSWKFIDDARFYTEDVIYFEGLFYAVHKSGEISVCDVTGDLPSVSFIETPMQIGGDMQYLVKTNDEFLLLAVVYKTVEFCVFWLILEGPRWEKINSLGEKLLFLGENSSLALLASDFPGWYYNLEDGSIEALSCYPRNSHSILHWPPQIWFTPNPC
ncbi:unnamed protein product [Withania somnifera]